LGTRRFRSGNFLVVGTAAGARKTETILRAIRRKYINALVIDEAAGLGILSLREQPGNPRPSDGSRSRRIGED